MRAQVGPLPLLARNFDELDDLIESQPRAVLMSWLPARHRRMVRIAKPMLRPDTLRPLVFR